MIDNRAEWVPRRRSHELTNIHLCNLYLVINLSITVSYSTICNLIYNLEFIPYMAT